MKIQQRYKDYKNRKLFRIHVSYNFTKEDGSYGFARKILSLSKRATLEEIENHIKAQDEYRGVVVLSWQPLKEY